MLYKKINQWRVIPRIIAFFVMYMMYAFHMWFTNNGELLITDMSEWSLVGYASVQATSIGFFKFYMESGTSTKD